MDRLNALRTFCSVVERGSFAAAARALRFSNAAVSKNIRELEAALGVRLLTRTTRQMSVTAAGQLYYDRVRRALDQMEDADNAVTELAGEPRGTLRVTAPMSLGLSQITPALPEFMRRYPAVTLDLNLSDEKADLVAGRFDVAIRGHGPLDDSTHIARRIAALRRVICAAPDYLARRGVPADPSDLETHACLTYSNAAKPERWTLRQDGREVTVHVTGPYRVNNSLAIRDALLGGVGVSLLPRVYVESDFNAGRLASILDEWRPEGQDIYAIYPAGAFLAAPVRAFINFTVELFADASEGA